MHLPGKITRNGGTLVKYSYLVDGSKTSALKGNGEGLVYRGSLIYRRASDEKSTGDYYSYWGYYVGTDGLDDNKTYLIDDLSITNYLNAQSISQLDAVDALTDGAYEVDGLIIVTREQKDTDRTIGTFDAIGDDGFSGYT